MTATVRLAVGPMVLADWRTRALAITAEADAPNPWAKYLDATGVGYADLTLAELDEVIAQALDVTEGDDDPGRRAAYDRILRKATRARVDLIRPHLTAVELAEAVTELPGGATAAPDGDARIRVWLPNHHGAPTAVVTIAADRIRWGTGPIPNEVQWDHGETPARIADALIDRLTAGDL